jgi:hypothetical protein
LKSVESNSLPPDRAKNLKSPSCQNISDRFKGKEWLVLIRPPLAGFDSTADSTQIGYLTATSEIASETGVLIVIKLTICRHATRQPIVP